MTLFPGLVDSLENYAVYQNRNYKKMYTFGNSLQLIFIRTHFN